VAKQRPSRALVIPLASSIAKLDPEREAQLKIELGVPKRARLGSISFIGTAKPLKGWLFELIGIPQARVKNPTQHQFYRLVFYRDSEGGEQWETLTTARVPRDFEQTRGPIISDLMLQVWSIRASYTSSPVFADRRWHPDIGLKNWTGGIPEGEHPPSWGALAERQFKAMRDFTSLGAGRPPNIQTGIKICDENDYQSRILERVYKRARGAGIKNLRTYNKSNIAEWLNLSPPTITKWNTKSGITWDDIFEWRVGQF
jgi:hypothetical protein